MILRVDIKDGGSYTSEVYSWTPFNPVKLRLIVKGTTPSVQVDQAVSDDGSVVLGLSTITTDGVHDVSVFPKGDIKITVNGTAMYCKIVEVESHDVLN
jgi:hypothetical protein